jgi:hypothetical protein
VLTNGVVLAGRRYNRWAQGMYCYARKHTYVAAGAWLMLLSQAMVPSSPASHPHPTHTPVETLSIPTPTPTPPTSQSGTAGGGRGW